jgi:hypothetical protein
MINSVPTGYRWFDKTAFDSEEALGQYIRGLAEVTAPTTQTTEELKYISTLTSSTGLMLDFLGASYGIPRIALELDDDYAIRIQQELLIERVTEPAIVSGAQAMAPGVEAFEPWRFLPKPSENWMPSGDTPLMSSDYWTAAVFDLIFWATRGDVPGVQNFLDTMKAYGVKAWYTIRHPDAYIDTNDDPLIPDAVINYLPNGNPDPRTPHKANNVVVANILLQTDDVAGYVGGFLPSCLEGLPSEDCMPSGYELIWFNIEGIVDMNAQMCRNLLAGDPIPTVGYDRQSPNYYTDLGNGFVFSSIPTADLSKNVIITTDIFTSETAGYNVYTIVKEDFTPATTCTDIQAKCVVRQMTSLGDPGTLGSGLFIGGEVVSS